MDLGLAEDQLAAGESGWVYSMIRWTVTLAGISLRCHQ